MPFGQRGIVSVSTAAKLLDLFWPNFFETNGCVFWGSPWEKTEPSKDPVADECLSTHVHLLDEFRNRATREISNAVSEDLVEVEEFYDEMHPDFATACEIGRTMAKMWAYKLKADFPHDRFRVYYTQYDNPIVRFHKVRASEPDWVSDEVCLGSEAPTLRSMVIYDTDYLDRPVSKPDSIKAPN